MYVLLDLVAELAALNKKAEAAAAKAKATQEKAIKAAEDDGVEPPDLEALAADAMPRRGLARKADGTPTNKTKHNHRFVEGFAYTDPDSVHQVIVSVGVSYQPPDVELLGPMAERTAANTGTLPKVMTMHAGYWSEDNANACADQGIDDYIAAGRLPHAQPLSPKRGPMPKDAVARATNS